MRVMIVAPGRFHAYDMARQLEKAGLDYRLVTSYYKKDSLSQIVHNPTLTYIPYALSRLGMNSVANRIKMVGLVRMACKIVSEFCPDVFHGFAGYSLECMKALQGRAALVLDRGSTHVKFQNAILREEHAKLGKRFDYNQKIEKKQLDEYKAAEKIFVPSPFVYNTFLDNGVDDDRLKLIQYGVDISKFRPGRKTDDVFRLLFVGNAAIRKGVHYLLQAFSELALQNSELVLVGRVQSEVSKIAKIPQNCRFSGHISAEELVRLYQSSSVFVLPSLEEGSALSTYEVMACGIPQIVTTNTGSMARDGKEGLVIPIRDVGALKDAMLYMYENEQERKRMGMSARKLAQKYTWYRYGKSVIKAYKELCQG